MREGTLAIEGASRSAAALPDRDAAFALLDARRLGDAYRLASLILRDASEAEDVTQEAIAVAWSRWSSLRDPNRFDAWFDRILVNLCRDRLRRRRHHAVVEIAAAEDRTVPDVYATIDRRDEIGRSFERLTADQRAVVVLRYYRDLPLEGIAERLDIPEGTVKSRLHTALGVMRASLDAARRAGKETR
jgi:RNA polymerase sigma factor (sigma-70 family)